MALIKAEEFAQKGKHVTYKLSWYIAQVESLDGIIWLMMKAGCSREEIIDLWDISDRFLEISEKRHSGVGPEEGMSEVLEQIAEVRAKKFKDSELRKDEELFKKDSDLRLKEKVAAVEVFLTETQYSPQHVAELVGISVSRVDRIKEILSSKSLGH